MKKLTKIAVLAASAALATQGAFAASGDLYLGLANNDNGGKNDFTLDLGQFSALTPGVTVTTTQSVAALETGLGGTSSVGWDVGAIFGLKGGSAKAPINDVISSVLHGASGPGGTPPSASQIASAASTILGLPAGEHSLSPSVDINSWTFNVAKDPTTGGANTGNSFVDFLPTANPMQAVTGSSIILDLYEATSSGSALTPFSFVGDLLVDFSGQDLTYTFDPAVAAAPEPSTYGVLAGAGLLALTLSRQLRRKTA